MKNTSKIVAGIIGALVMALVLAVFVSPSLKKASADIIANTYFGLASNTSVLCPQGVPTLLVATSTGRQFARVSNLAASTMYLGLGVRPASTTGMYLNASSSVEFSQNNIIFAGAIYCLSEANATATVTTIP